jgi:hypothetical protein
MKIDVSLYSSNLPFVKILIDRNKEKTPVQMVNVITKATECPIVASAYLIATHIGMTKELQDFVDRMVIFYKYTEISGIQETYALIKKE